MRTITAKQQKILKIAHITVMSIWFSSIISLVAIMLTLPNISNAEVLVYSHKIQEIVDFVLLTPAAALTLVTGLIYIFFTKWKLKQSWLMWKLIITIVIIVAGTFWLGPALMDCTTLAEQHGMKAFQMAEYNNKMQIGLYAGYVNTALVLFAIAISTLKPNRNKKAK